MCHKQMQDKHLNECIITFVDIIMVFLVIVGFYFVFSFGKKKKKQS